MTPKPNRTPILAILVFLAILTFFYHVLPTLVTTTDYITTSLVTTFRSQSIVHAPSPCTEEVGRGLCCDLHLGAQPCIDECRKEHTDRETFELTREYELCENQCLSVYQTACAQDASIKDNAPPSRLTKRSTSQ
ncbi:hypothetical protein BU24DRAFT_228077 [Aaosphaeria arxii CBS 175.79]|uniref:Uncharacterized protein n=1 Tax=Aaosphaeria arxii CBS 175.79 TaxID=1450172 RepID=A0A6A5XQH7_9PLEO|nr:uncharacterized protein BU24DRAFT_228077 [Aaosphaeria arxii CBS 175.79]KAF2015087.1 hypothetical protein BU24DRAFT_228077 [Aaosphaeria arxii CBS 175.79]